MYRYEAQYNDELTFDEGDLLYIIEQSDPSWWKAKCGNKTGLIPSNYVEENMEAVDNPLHEAAKRGNISFMQECINNKVSVNGLDKAGSIPLHWAAHGGHTECVQMLLQVPNCQINVQNKLGDTPLHSAAWKGHANVVQLLLDRGAELYHKNNEGKTAYDLAKEPSTASLLRHNFRPQTHSNDYGDEEDSD